MALLWVAACLLAALSFAGFAAAQTTTTIAEWTFATCTTSVSAVVPATPDPCYTAPTNGTGSAVFLSSMVPPASNTTKCYYASASLGLVTDNWFGATVPMSTYGYVFCASTMGWANISIGMSGGRASAVGPTTAELVYSTTGSAVAGFSATAVAMQAMPTGSTSAPAFASGALPPSADNNPNFCGALVGMGATNALGVLRFASLKITGTALSLSSCAAGYYCPPASLGPQLCPAGHYCPPGSTMWRDKNCGRGHYCPWGSSAPISCPPKGTVDSALGPANGEQLQVVRGRPRRSAHTSLPPPRHAQAPRSCPMLLLAATTASSAHQAS